MNNEKRIITLQATGSLDCEKKKEKKMIKNDVVWSTLFKFVMVFINNAQFVIIVWMLVKFIEWKFTLYTLMKMQMIFCSIDLIKSYWKSK